MQLFKNPTYQRLFDAQIDTTLFIFAVLFGHALWHIIFPGLTMESTEVLVFNRFDITPYTYHFQLWLADQQYFLSHLINDNVIQNGLDIFIPGHMGSQMAWGCTGIKQAMIFTLAIGISRGAHRNKWWFIPIGLVVLHVVNLIRVTALFFIITNNSELFPLFHNHILKYAYYVIIFLIWLIWQFRFNPKFKISAVNN
ncbi:MAG: exosortase/archaeosortase family protein [Paludibacteraceae bacterium]|nr:exosortase/archaeosortase family protein [Paludibacteraceae bacterium]